MTQPCDKGPQLERMEKKIDSIHDVLTKVAVQDNEIEHLKKAVEPIPGLVKWKERWGGAVIGLSIVGTVLGILGAFKVLL